MKQEFETPGSPVTVPYKWEAAPGRPIVEAVPAPTLEPWKSPLRPPPGARKVVAKPLEFRGVEPKPPIVPVTEPALAEKILKKLNRLRRKSMIAAACFTTDALRVIEHSGRLFATEDLDRCSLEYDTMSSGSTFDQQPSTPCSSTSFESSFSEPNFSMRSSTCVGHGAMPASPYTTRARPSSCRFEEVEQYIDHDNESETLPGPRESAWHQQSGELAMEPPPLPLKRPSIRRSYSALIPSLLRQSTSARSSFKQLSLGRTFRRPKTTRQLDYLGNV
jgi:hypothetical protein